MSHPQSFTDFLAGPVYVVNMDRDKERWETATKRLNAAGFSNITRWSAVDGSTCDFTQEWKKHGSPKFDPSDDRFLDVKGSAFKQGITLSHLALLKHIIDQNVAWAFIMEDDIIFHKDWDLLAAAYFNATPKDYDLCYVGHHCGCGKPYSILQVPVYCTHAFIITNDGAKTLYNRLLSEPQGIRTIDCMIATFMARYLQHGTPFLKWYAWNAEKFPDNTATKHPQHAHKDQGLVFQEYIHDRTHH